MNAQESALSSIGR